MSQTIFSGWFDGIGAQDDLDGLLHCAGVSAGHPDGVLLRTWSSSVVFKAQLLLSIATAANVQPLSLASSASTTGLVLILVEWHMLVFLASKSPLIGLWLESCSLGWIVYASRVRNRWSRSK